MPNNFENTTGLQHCYWRKNGELFSIEKGATIYLYNKDINEFVVDERCVGGKTTNPQYTLDNARWAFIYDVFFRSFANREAGSISENLWGPLSGGRASVSKYALGTKYSVGRSIRFNPSGDSYYYGYKQRVELFSVSPGTGFYFYIIPVTTSKIDYAYFRKSEEIKRYGDSVSLTIMFHGYNLEKTKKYKAKVYLLEETEAVGLTETEDFEDKNLWDNPFTRDIYTRESDDNYNFYLHHSFNINIDWKKGADTTKNFTVVVEVYEAYTETGFFGGESKEWRRINYKNYANEPTKDLVNYNAELLQIQDIDKKDSTSSRFMVSAELMTDYLFRIERDKNNMIQYIGDIEYNQQEFDPCGYSKITIQDKGDSERNPLIIFDETQPSNQIDRTNHIFGIIAGDERKDISITLDGLQTQNQFCQGLLLDERQKHTDHKNVFQVDNVYSTLNKGKTRQNDTTHQEQQRNAGITPSESNSNDTDVIRTNDSYNPTATQQWKDGTDYKIESDKEITLKLKYLYNKTFLEGNLNGYPAEIINNLWLFNYFILSDNMAQIYFLPISTCRYPNQIAKIKVYPNVSWTFHFNYGMENPLYYRDTWVKMRQHRVDDAVIRSQASDIDGYDGTVETKFGLSIEAKWNGSESAKLDQKISEKVKLLIGSFVKIKQFVDKVTGKDRGNSTEGLIGGVLERARRTPLTIEVLSPQISVGAGWEYKIGEKERNLNHECALTLNLVAKAEPAIGAEAIIDLIAWGKKLHPAAEAVITALDLMAYAANASIRFDLKFYGKLIIEGNIELSRLKKEGSLKAEGQFGFELILQAKATGKVNAIFYEADYDFEAKAQGGGYFALGLSVGLDDYKGLYLEPIVRHSGIKITLSFTAKFGSTERAKTEEFIVIKEDKLESIAKKYYIND